MIRLFFLSVILFSFTCNRFSNSSTDSGISLPDAETTTGLNEQGPISTTTATPPPPAFDRTSSEVVPRSGEPQTYGSTAVLTPAQGLSEDEASIMSLLGSWQNQSDEGEIMEFAPESYSIFYEGEKVVEEAVVYHTNCPASCTGGAEADFPCFVVSSAYHTDCFGIVRMTTNEMELTILGQSTATVLYNRVNP